MKVPPFPARLGLLIACCLVAGCEEKRPATTAAAAPGLDQLPAVAGTAESDGPVDLKIATWREVQAAVTAHQGKPVVLDLWASW